MVHAAHLVRARQHPEAAVFLCAWVQCQEDRPHIRSETAVLVPIPVVLMPDMPAAYLHKQQLVLKEHSCVEG